MLFDNDIITARTLVCNKKVDAAAIETVEIDAGEYAVSVEAQEVAVAAEIENAEKAEKINSVVDAMDNAIETIFEDQKELIELQTSIEKLNALNKIYEEKFNSRLQRGYHIGLLTVTAYAIYDNLKVLESRKARLANMQERISHNKAKLAQLQSELDELTNAAKGEENNDVETILDAEIAAIDDCIVDVDASADVEEINAETARTSKLLPKNKLDLKKLLEAQKKFKTALAKGYLKNASILFDTLKEFYKAFIESRAKIKNAV